MSADVTAVILAAGTSSRMGKPKQLLRLGGIPLVERVIRSVLPFHFSEVIAVIGHEAEKIEQMIPITDDRFRWVANPDYLSGQSTSLRKGINSSHSSSAMIFLGDQPMISEKTIWTVFEYGREKQAASDEPFVVRPHFQSTPGHPVFLGNVRKMDFTALEGDHGAKAIIGRMKNQYHLPVRDSGVVLDVDTPEAYEKLKRMWLWDST
jgi:molybdenum cofactor cytidylyltransferase